MSTPCKTQLNIRNVEDPYCSPENIERFIEPDDMMSNFENYLEDKDDNLDHKELFVLN